MKHLHRRVDRVAAVLAKRQTPAVSAGTRCSTCRQPLGAETGGPNQAALLEAMTVPELQELCALRDRVVVVYQAMNRRGQSPACPECGLVRYADLMRRANGDELAALEQVSERLAALQLAVSNRLAVAAAR
jgi:hypothetical protein